MKWIKLYNKDLEHKVLIALDKVVLINKVETKSKTFWNIFTVLDTNEDSCAFTTYIDPMKSITSFFDV